MLLAVATLEAIRPVPGRSREEYKRKDMGTELELKAPEGKFRVVGVDTFDGTDWIIDDYTTEEEAKEVARETGGIMTKTHVYDDQGKHIFEAGTF